MKRFPEEFEALLTPSARKCIQKRSVSSLRDAGNSFVSMSGWIRPKVASDIVALLDATLTPLLTPMEEPIPAWTISAMRENYAELLPKTVRVQTAVMASSRSKAFVRAKEIGLVDMLKSESFRALAEALSGFRLRRKWGTQVLCYGPGDYTGPHNDHHPEDIEAAHGYVDLHVTFCHRGVLQQFLVYAKGGHFSEIQSVATFGGLTCYRLPFWHYTTPLVVKPGWEKKARRWVLLGTFLDADANIAPSPKVAVSRSA